VRNHRMVVPLAAMVVVPDTVRVVGKHAGFVVRIAAVHRQDFVAIAAVVGTFLEQTVAMRRMGSAGIVNAFGLRMDDEHEDCYCLRYSRHVLYPYDDLLPTEDVEFPCWPQHDMHQG
jgi:hypothetical protein